MKHVAVLMGGWSAEREVSLSSGRACAAALEYVWRYRVAQYALNSAVAVSLHVFHDEDAGT